MDIVKTKNFELAVYKKGSESSDKLILCLPGRLDTKDYLHMRSHVDHFAGKGHLAVSFDPPGTWESPGGIALYTMTNYHKAIDEVIEYFGNKPTALIGHSRGGSMALLAGPLNSSVTHFASIMGKDNYDVRYDSVTTQNEWKEKGFTESYRDLPPGSQKKEKLFKLPYNFVEDSQQYDMREALRNCSKPKLFIAGTQDELVSVDTVKTAFDNAAEPKEFYALESDHDYRYHQNLIEKVNGVLDEFLKEF